MDSVDASAALPSGFRRGVVVDFFDGFLAAASVLELILSPQLPVGLSAFKRTCFGYPGSYTNFNMYLRSTGPMAS
jgi:hypothetical protein